MISRIGVIAVVTIGLLGCGNSAKEKVACDGVETKGLVQQAFLEQVDRKLGALQPESLKKPKDEILKMISVSVSSARPDAFDETVSKYTCKADMEVTLPPRTAAILNDRSKWAVQMFLSDSASVVTENGLMGSITYTSQLDESGDNHYVELRGHDLLVKAIEAASFVDAF